MGTIITSPSISAGLEFLLIPDEGLKTIFFWIVEPSFINLTSLMSLRFEFSLSPPAEKIAKLSGLLALICLRPGCFTSPITFTVIEAWEKLDPAIFKDSSSPLDLVLLIFI